MGRHSLPKGGGLRVSDLTDRAASGADERYAAELAAIETPRFAATQPRWPEDPPTERLPAIRLSEEDRREIDADSRFVDTEDARDWYREDTP